MARYLTAILAGSLLSAQEPAESLRPRFCSWSRNSITGAPVRKADVMLRTAAANGGQGVRAGSTGASGAFAFENLSAENYLISAQRNGFVRQDGVLVARRLASGSRV